MELFGITGIPSNKGGDFRITPKAKKDNAIDITIAATELITNELVATALITDSNTTIKAYVFNFFIFEININQQ